MRSSLHHAEQYRAKLLSPFRYPGGKTWLVSLICQWLHTMNSKPTEFIEPFAGGSIVGLNVAFKKLAEHVTLVELDEDVAAVWRTIIDGEATSLADRMVSFDLTLDSVRDVLSATPHSLQERAFQTILKNRVNRAGILAPSAGMLRNGENGRGIKSRWYPETLRKRILEIDRMRERISFIEGDGFEVLRQHLDHSIPSSLARFAIGTFPSAWRLSFLRARFQHVVFFIDPPYTAGKKRAGSRLYNHFEIDHEELFRLASALDGEFLMTYSDDEEVRQLARQHRFDSCEITMRSSHHKRMTELLIGRNLNWLRRLRANAQ